MLAVLAPHHLRNVGGGLAQQKRFRSLRCPARIFRVAGFKICQCLRAADVFVRHFLSSSSSSDTPGKTIHVSQRSTHRFSQFSRQ
jgi:hypothetical protein